MYYWFDNFQCLCNSIYWFHILTTCTKLALSSKWTLILYVSSTKKSSFLPVSILLNADCNLFQQSPWCGDDVVSPCTWICMHQTSTFLNGITFLIQTNFSVHLYRKHFCDWVYVFVWIHGMRPSTESLQACL